MPYLALTVSLLNSCQEILAGWTKPEDLEPARETELTRKYSSAASGVSEKQRDRVLLDHGFLSEVEESYFLRHIANLNQQLREQSRNPLLEDGSLTNPSALRAREDSIKEFNEIKERQNKHVDALRRHNERFIQSRVRTFFRHSLFDEDNVSRGELFQVGRSAFVRAILDFDASSGNNYRTLAGQYIKRDCMNELKNTLKVSKARALQDFYQAYHRARKLFEMKEGRSPNDNELAVAIGFKDASCFADFHTRYAQMRGISFTSMNTSIKSSRGPSRVSLADMHPSFAVAAKQDTGGDANLTAQQAQLKEIESLISTANLTSLEEVCLKLNYGLGAQGRYDFSSRVRKVDPVDIDVSHGQVKTSKEIASIVGLSSHQTIINNIHSGLEKMRAIAALHDDTVIYFTSPDELKAKLEDVYQQHRDELEAMDFNAYVSWFLNEATNTDVFETPHLRLSERQVQLLKLRIGINSQAYSLEKATEHMGDLLPKAKKRSDLMRKMKMCEELALTSMTNIFREKPNGLLPCTEVETLDREVISNKAVLDALYAYSKKHGKKKGHREAPKELSVDSRRKRKDPSTVAF